ncbi:MAG: DUF2784 domain-containing protein [Bacteroidota bacterium]
MLAFFDGLLFVIHLVVIGINLFAWAWKRTRRLHLWVAGTTVFSWMVLGIWYGFGYCVLTDWEWDIKRQLGETNLPHSFTQYLSDNIFGLYLSTTLVDGLTLGLFVIAILCSVYVNFFRNRSS